MKKAFWKHAALLFSFVLVLSLIPSYAIADDGTEYDPEKSPEPYSVGGMVPMPVTSTHDESVGPLISTASLPATFRLDDSRLTPVRNQIPYGTCWVFAAIGSAESILKSKNLASNPDFSEWQLAYNAFTKVDGQPAFHLSAGETPYNVGGNDCMAAAMLTREVSPVWESQVPYDSGTPAAVYAPEYTLKSWSIAHKVYDIQDNTEWKTMLMEKGALSVSYLHNPGYCYEGTTTSYYSPVASTYTNHGVTLVGWDDNYSYDNFRSTPPGNGAWIIKNSWGDTWGDDGYFYISYYDKTLSMNAGAFELMPRTANEKMYTHDELGWQMILPFKDNEIIYTKSVFTAESTEKLTTIGIYAKSDNTAYTIQIRKANQSGEFVNAWGTSQSGIVANAGYSRIDLNSPVLLSAGQKYEVIVSYANPDTGTSLPVEFTPSSNYAAGQSFYSTDGTNWIDLYTYFPLGPCDTCIFAFTLPESAPVHTVTFEAQGGSEVEPVSIAAGTLLSEPADPKKTGCTFGGWYTDPACTDKWDFANDKMPDADLSLYAKWITNQYTAYLDCRGGSTLAAVTANYGALIQAPIAPAKEGHRFLGWYKEPSCVTPWNFSSETMPAGNVTLYAGWALCQYTASFDSQSGSPVASAGANYGALIQAPIAPAKEGHRFLGWYKEPSCHTPWNFSSDTMPAGNITLYAGWTLCQYTVVFDSQGGSPVASVGASYGSTVAEPAGFTRSGYNFTGWYREPSCVSKWNFAADRVTADVTLYAGWAAQIQAPTLSGITLSAGSLSSAFSPSGKSCTVYLDENTGSVTVTPIKTYDGATLTINGKRVNSQTLSVACGKSASLTMKVSLGKKSTTVKLTVKRAKSANNMLSSLTPSVGTLSPAFNPNVTTYTLTLPAGTSKVKLAAARASSLAKASPASKAYSVKPGKTVTATIKVKAQSGAVRIYKIYITRAIQ